MLTYDDAIFKSLLRAEDSVTYSVTIFGTRLHDFFTQCSYQSKRDSLPILLLSIGVEEIYTRKTIAPPSYGRLK